MGSVEFDERKHNADDSDNPTPWRRPSADTLQASVYRLREEIDAGNRVIQEQARKIAELTEMLKRENDEAEECRA